MRFSESVIVPGADPGCEKSIYYLRWVLWEPPDSPTTSALRYFAFGLFLKTAEQAWFDFREV